MVVLGPLQVQQPQTNPSFNKEMENALQKLQSTGINMGIHDVNNIPSSVMTGTQIVPKSAYDYSSPKQSYSKFPDLYTSMDPMSYSYNGHLAVYPVDTLNMAPANVPSYKHQLAEESSRDVYKQQLGADQSSRNVYQKSSELENILSGKVDFDLGSLLSLSMPENKDSCGADSSYLIPDALDFLSETSPQQSYEPFELSNQSPPSTVPDVMPAMVPDGLSGMEYWDKEGIPLDSTKMIPLIHDPTTDPFMAGIYSSPPTHTNDSLQQYRSDSDDRSLCYPSPTGSMDNIFNGTPQQLSPPQAPPLATPPSNETKTDTTQLDRTNSWDEHLKELFEKTFDLSDEDVDFLLPPPNKRIHGTVPTGNTPTGNTPIGIAPTPPALDWSQNGDINPGSQTTSTQFSKPPSACYSDPPTPETKPAIASPPNESKRLRLSSSENNGKAMIFGQHEDDIIHKLVSVPRNGQDTKPVTRDKLVSMPVEEFNHLLDITELSDIEVAFMKEWRRRGKNKTAAQIARKRKREEVSDLDVQVQKMKQQKVELQKKYDQYRSKIAGLKEKCIAAEDKVYQRQSKIAGKPVSRDTHLIHMTDDGKLIVVPRISSKILMLNK